MLPYEVRFAGKTVKLVCGRETLKDAAENGTGVWRKNDECSFAEMLFVRRALHMNHSF